MAETNINIVDALRGQQDQLKRLIAQQVWISQAAKPTLADMQAQVTEIKRLLDQLEVDIKGARSAELGKIKNRSYTRRGRVPAGKPIGDVCYGTRQCDSLDLGP